MGKGKRVGGGRERRIYSSIKTNFKKRTGEISKITVILAHKPEFESQYPQKAKHGWRMDLWICRPVRLGYEQSVSNKRLIIPYSYTGRRVYRVPGRSSLHIKF